MDLDLHFHQNKLELAKSNQLVTDYQYLLIENVGKMMKIAASDHGSRTISIANKLRKHTFIHNWSLQSFSQDY